MALEIRIKLTEYNVRTDAVRRRISTSQPAHRFRDKFLLPFKNVDFENVRQGRKVQHSQKCHSMDDIDVYKSHGKHLTLRYGDSKVLVVGELKSFHGVQHSHWFHSDECRPP